MSLNLILSLLDKTIKAQISQVKKVKSKIESKQHDTKVVLRSKPLKLEFTLKTPFLTHVH